MKKRRLIIITGILCFLFVMFGISYNISLNIFGQKHKTQEIKENEKSESYVSASRLNEVLSTNTDIILKLKVRDIEKELPVKNIKVGDLKNVINDSLTLKNIEAYYNESGYKLESNSSKELVFIKESKFEPNKYYLGASDGYISVLKCNNEGQLFLEDPLTDKSSSKVEILPESDRELINNFEFKFDSKDEALEELGNISS